MKVSVIIPNYNREKLIAETLDSFIVQDYSNWECIIVDDGSTDRSVEIIKEFCKEDSRFRLLVRPKEMTKGANTCRNLGFEAAKGEFINWFDSDDVLLPGFLSERMEIFKVSPQLELIITACTMTDEHLNPVQKWELKENSDIFYKDYVLWKQKIITGSILFRKDFLNGKKLFNPIISRGQEGEFFTRILFKLPSEKFRILNASLFLYRQHPNSKSGKNINYVRNFRLSQAIICLNLLEKGFQLKDKEIIRFYYKLVSNLFYAAIRHKDFKNVFYTYFRANKILLTKFSPLIFDFNLCTPFQRLYKNLKGNDNIHGK